MKKLLLLAAQILALAIPQFKAAAGPIADLTVRDLYVRNGFSCEWINSLPEPGDGWKKIPGSAGGGRSVKVRELRLEGVPERGFLSLRSSQDRIFTFVTSFVLREEHISVSRLLGVHLAAIGENWEVFVNGSRILSEMHTGRNGAIETWRAQRDVFAPIDPRLLREGENILAFRIVGDPTFNDTGLFQSSPYFIDEYRTILDLNSEITPLVLIFLYLFVGVYHLFLFINRREEKYNLFYGLFSVCLFVYLFARTHAIYRIVPDTDTVLRMEFVSLYMLIPLLGGFFDLILDRRLRMFTLVYGAFCVLLASITIPTPRPFALDVLRIWQLSALVALVYYAFYKIGYRFFCDARERYLRAAERGGTAGAWRVAGIALATSVSGNLLVGVMVLFSTALFDIVDSMFLDLDLVLTRYGFFVFMVGTALILANRFLSLHGRVRSLNENLERKIEDLDRANRTVSLSEEKYRLIVEGTNDGIFSLDDQWRFITVNRSMLKELHVGMEELRRQRLHDLVHESPEEQGVTMRLLQQKLDELAQERRPLNLRLKLKSFMGSEPRDFHMRLEAVDVEGKREYLGKVSSVVEDSLLQYFESERQKYTIGNYLITAEEISHRLVRNLVKYLDSPQVNMLRIGLREMILNAIEHGNLNISFEEKSAETMGDGYIEFVMRRRDDPRYGGRRVLIEYSLTPERVAYKIADEGSGFDHARVMNLVKTNVNEQMLAHGRGLTMAMNIFDQVRFNNRGNQVLLVKKFNSTGA